MTQKQYPKSALTFSAPVNVQDQGEGNRRFAGVAYSGGIIRNHPFWDAVMFDLSTTKVDSNIPVLYRHDEPIGVLDKATIDKGISVEGTLFTSFDPVARSVADKGDAGLPWQMSVHIVPGRIHEVEANQSITVNGIEFAGPGVVFKNGTVREASFVPLGADADTSAHIFSQSGNITIEVEMSDTETLAAKDQEIATLKASEETLKQKISDLESKFETQRIAKRTEDVKNLFAAMSMDYSDAVAKPFIDMSDEQFAATRDAMTKVKGKDDKSSLFSGGEIQARKPPKAAQFSAPTGHRIDEQGLALHEKASAFIAQNPKLDYLAAVQQASQE